MFRIRTWPKTQRVTRGSRAGLQAAEYGARARNYGCATNQRTGCFPVTGPGEAEPVGIPGMDAEVSLRSRFTDGIPVRARDFSQSCVEGPRILPSMYASPGQREQLLPCTQDEQPCSSAMVIARTSCNWGECRQISRKRVFLTLPLGSGNCTQGNTSPYGET